MNLYLLILVALLSTASVGLAQSPRAAIVTGEVHNPPSREVEFRHEPLLAPGPSEHPIVLDEQNRFALLLNISKGTLVTGYYRGERYFLASPSLSNPATACTLLLPSPRCRRPILRRQWNLTVWTVPKRRPLPLIP